MSLIRWLGAPTALLLSTCPALRADTVTSDWTGASNVWTEPLNWAHSLPIITYPDNGLQGNLYEVVIAGATVSLDADITIQRLALIGSTLTGSNMLTIQENLDLTGPGGSLESGPGVCHVVGVVIALTMLTVDDWMLEVDGFFIVGNNAGVDGEVVLLGASCLDLDGGMSFQRDGQLTVATAIPFVTNTNGAIEKRAAATPTSVSEFQARLVDSDGIIRVTAGELRFTREATLVETDFELFGTGRARLRGGPIAMSGEVMVRARDSGRLIVEDAPVVLTGVLRGVLDGAAIGQEVSLTGPAASLSGGTVDFPPDFPFRQDGGAVGTTGQVENTGTYAWASGPITGAGLVNRSVRAATVLPAIAGAGRSVTMGTLANEQTFRQEHPIDIGAGGLVRNEASGTWEMTSATADLAGSGTFENLGVVRKDTASSSVDVLFDNQGLVEVLSGELRFEPDRLLQFDAGTATLDGGSYDALGGVIHVDTGAASLTTVGAATVIRLDGATAALTPLHEATGFAGALSVTGGADQGFDGSVDLAGVFDVGPGSSITAVGAVTITGTGTLIGAGTVHATTVDNGGVVAPGDVAEEAGPVDPTARLDVGGAYVQPGGGVLEIDLAGPNAGDDHDQLRVTGDATLDGTLDVRLVGGFVPQVADTFVVLTAGAVAGAFDCTSLPALPGASWRVETGPTSVTLVIEAGTTSPGDVNRDGVVNVFDLLLVLGEWGPCTVMCCEADVNVDGVINVFDLLIVLGDWG